MKFYTATTTLIISSILSIAQGSYDLKKNDVKCPFSDQTRLFRTSNANPVTLEACYNRCYELESCHYFSHGSPSSGYEGVCIGCTEDAVLASHAGIHTYELTEKKAFPTPAPVPPSACLENGDSFLTNGCDYESFLEGLEDFLDDYECGDHDAQAVLEAILPGSPQDTIHNVCAHAWDKIPTSTFSDIDGRFNNAFMEEYINGDTFLNENTGTFQGTVEGNNIDAFRDDGAKKTVMQPISSLTCQNNAMMCCFGRDRQPNDNNGNCKDPVETNCRDASPADNSNLCWTDTDSPTFSDPFAFPEKSEGSIHCHGLAWTEDENSFESQLRYNNLFFVSLYDHMYTRGYVETTVDSEHIGMCDCIENMPVVSRSDCTQVDVDQAFTVTYNSGSGFSAVPSGGMNIEFNSCQGINPTTGQRKNNDLGSYVYRLHQDERISDSTKEAIFDTLVGYANPNDNNNEPACARAYEETFEEAYPVAGQEVGNLKCPQNADRVFRTVDNDPLSLEECQELCYDTPECQYFSIGLSANAQHKGVCIGCTADAELEAHRGFNAYEMTSTQVFPTPAPTLGLGDYYNLQGENKKCPYTSSRLFKSGPNLTRHECYQECVNHPTCEYFTYGESDGLRDSWKGLCMGCTGGTALSTHNGFNTYALIAA